MYRGVRRPGRAGQRAAHRRDPRRHRLGAAADGAARARRQLAHPPVRRVGRPRGHRHPDVGQPHRLDVAAAAPAGRRPASVAGRRACRAASARCSACRSPVPCSASRSRPPAGSATRPSCPPSPPRSSATSPCRDSATSTRALRRWSPASAWCSPSRSRSPGLALGLASAVFIEATHLVSRVGPSVAAVVAAAAGRRRRRPARSRGAVRIRDYLGLSMPLIADAALGRRPTWPPGAFALKLVFTAVTLGLRRSTAAR